MFTPLRQIATYETTTEPRSVRLAVVAGTFHYAVIDAIAGKDLDAGADVRWVDWGLDSPDEAADLAMAYTVAPEASDGPLVSPDNSPWAATIVRLIH